MQVEYDAHKWLTMYYSYLLMYTKEGEKAHAYLKERGISDETIKTFQLGYASKDSSIMMTVLKNKGFTEEDILNRKIISVSQRGNYFDPFYDRIIFPINDFDSRVSGFGGRSMDKNNKIKYLNSPETRIFKKQDNLYGFHQAKEFVKEDGYLVLFEGYFDVLQSHQNGLKNCVACLGTALTPEQALLIKSITKNVVIVLDNDAAGINASFRSASVLEEVGVNALVGTLQSGLDPDEWFKKYQDKERFVNEVIKTAINRKDFLINQKVNSIDINNSNERFSILNELLSNLPSDINERNYWLELANEKLNVPTDIILNVIHERGA